MNDFFSKNDYN